MKLNQIFQKPVDRTIEGVIKVDDETSLGIEVEEYVLTNEVARQLENFLNGYNNYRGANGGWISGFFGSGKSHLLKVLALLLENRVVEGKPAAERFLPKCADNAILKAEIQKAVAIPSHSILFNIDQKADVISKTQVDALLAVFVKVFDEMCGYYGKQGYIARFERDLDKRGLYAQFQTAYQHISGIDWKTGREQALLEAEAIAKAYAQVNRGSSEMVSNILEKYRSEYKVSIEDFALQINEYVESRGKNFRLNFFVDEVGQYIANNTKLMTNLQTIAESLATKCRGRSWMIVTAQEEMEDVLGKMTAQQGNDFSKIQDRFKARLKLTSQNVDEVIQKRLLLKNSRGTALLADVYREQSNNFGTLFDFSDGSQNFRNFRDQQHFTDSYPFPAYQFGLFQAAILNLSIHNAFEGKHSSVGERSLLAVFQQVAIHVANQEVGEMATFDLMYEGIRNALKAQIQQAILTAENQLDNPFAVRVLKALFLVKYIKEFKATLHNLCVLMVDHFGQDMLQLRQEVETALNLLEQQTYIQRNGDLYEYLTNEEKDVEVEIKNTEVETAAVAAELAKILFDSILKDRKIQFEENKQDFPFTRKLDDALFGKEHELTINIASPFHEFFDYEETLRIHSMGRDEMLVILPADDRLVLDLLMYKRTEKYVQQNISVTQQESIKKILSEKTFQNRERYQHLEARGKDLLSRAKLFISGDPIEVAGSDPASRLMRGFQELVRRIYPNLKMLHSINYSENDIEKYLVPAAGSLFGDASITLNEAEQEQLSFIQSNRQGGMRTTFKSLDERFEHKPYGWSLAAVQCTLAGLYAHGKVEVRSEGNLLEDTALARALRNTHAHAAILLEPQIEFSAGEVRKLKEFFDNFFDKPAQSTEARELGKEVGAALEERLNLLTQLVSNRALYPFLAELDEPIRLLKDVVKKPYAFYFVELPRHSVTLLDLKEQTIAPIFSFWNGPQKSQFDEARQFQQAQSPNFDYLDGSEATKLQGLLLDTTIFKGSRMQQVRSLVGQLRTAIAAQLELEKQNAVNTVEKRRDQLASMSEFTTLTADQQTQIRGAFDPYLAQFEAQALISTICEKKNTFEEKIYPQIVSRLVDLKQPKEKKIGEGGDVVVPPVEYVLLRSLPVEFGKPWLLDEKDAESYLEALRKALVAEIQRGKRIQL